MNLLATRGLKKGVQFVLCLSLVLLVALVGYVFLDVIGDNAVPLLLLMVVSLVAILFDRGPVLSAAVLSAAIWNFFFIPPVHSFHIDSMANFLMLLLYFVIALVNAVLTFEIRKAEQKAREKEEKEQTIKLYTTLLNSLSHELRTPLSTIVGAVDTLKEQKEKLSHAHQEELLDQVEVASMRLNRQVDNLLNMSRLETGMLKLHLDWHDINEMVYSILQKLPSDHGRLLHFQADEQLPLFKFDRGLMEQVVQNLLYNALYYTPPSSLVTIEATYKGERLNLTVADNGKGIAEQEQALVFEKFYRVPETKTGGSGLGLSIVKGFTEAHRGQVRLESNLGGGAKFYVEIPAETSYLNHLKNE